ncbi:MAG: hypothetical protein WBP85_08970 [Terracidiphilus sp.]
MEKEPQTNDYLASLLADMEAKKSALDAAMTAIRAAIVAGALGAPGDPQAVPSVLNPTVIPAGAADLPRGAFLGKTATEAIKLYLSAIRRKQTNKEIAQALRDGGLESAGDFGNFITSALFRLKKEGAVLRFDDGWGLSEWYNEAFRAKLGAPSGKKPAKRGKGKRKKPARKETASKAAPEIVTVPVASLDERIAGFLESRAAFPKEIANSVNAQRGAVNFALVRLVKKGLVIRESDGKYYAAKEAK